jgi:hypothetical protein
MRFVTHFQYFDWYVPYWFVVLTVTGVLMLAPMLHKFMPALYHRLNPDCDREAVQNARSLVVKAVCIFMTGTVV